MSRRHFDTTDNAELRAKIDEAKSRLSLPELMSRLGLGAHAKKSARCPFPGHDDKHPSFSVFQGKDGFWHYKCFVCDIQGGDEIAFLVKHLNISRREAVRRYLDMAGFPATRPLESREYPKSPEYREFPNSHASPEYSVSPCVSVYPVSEGQGLNGEIGKELQQLAARNACTRSGDRAERKRFKLARDVRAVEKKIGRELTTAELRLTCDEWERASLPFLDWNDDDHFAMFLAELTKVRVPTGEGDTFNRALENVSKLQDSDLPVIPRCPDARKAWRKLAALHCEMSRLCGNNIYFLSYRHAAKACKELDHQSAHTITLALARVGVIQIVRKGKAGPNSRKATEFRYLLPQAENGVSQTEDATHKASLPNQKPVASSW
jgi:hypothetical protein